MTATFNQDGTNPGIDFSAQLRTIGFGNNGFTQEAIIGDGPPENHDDTRTNFLSYRSAKGSGYPAGANHADIAGCFIAAKANWTVPFVAVGDASAQQGEVDGLYIIARQGDQGDVGGILIDVAKVEGPSGPLGFQGQTPLEAKSAVLSRTQSIAGIPSTKQVVQTVVAFSEDRGNGSMQSFGVCSEMRVGEGEAAFAARLSDESGQPNTVGPAPSWKWSFVSQVTRDASSRNFGIDGAGRVHFGTLSETKILESSDGFLRLRNAVGSADIFAIDTAGNVHLGGPADNKVIASAAGRFTVKNTTGGPELFSVDESGAAAVANTLTVNGGLLTLATTYTRAQLLTLTSLPTGSIALCSDGNGLSPAGPCLAFLSGAQWYNSATNAPL